MADGRAVQQWRALLQQHWPDCGELHRLNGEHDLNLADHRRVYKVSRPDTDPATLDLQVEALRQIAGRAAVPPVIPAHSGAARVSIEVEGTTRWVWAIGILPGRPAAVVRPWHDDLLRSIGAAIATLHAALAEFEHRALDRPLRWRIDQVLQLADTSKHLAHHPRAADIHRILSEHATGALQRLEHLPQQALHYDLNDHNLLCHCTPGGYPELSGIIDFGDMMRGARVVDLAIAAAYLLPRLDQPLRALRRLVAAYHEVAPLDADEVDLVWPLMLTRMATSMMIAYDDQCRGNDDPYRQVSQHAIYGFLDDALDVPPQEVARHLRAACGLADPEQAVLDWIAAPTLAPAPLFETALDRAPVLDLSIIGEHATDDPVAPDLASLNDHLHRLGAPRHAVLGRYREPRLIYGAPFFLSGDHGASDRRTVHIALDVFLPAGSSVHAPYDAVVHSAEVCDAEFDYGGLIVLAHEPTPGVRFYSLYGHLQHDSVRRWQPGDSIAAGQPFAQLGTPAENGGWPPHVHFQVSTTPAPGSDWPGVVDVDDLDYWVRRFPDPSRLAGLADGRALAPLPDKDLAARRAQHAPPNLRLSYAKAPLTIVRGWQSLLFDEVGRTYLDAYNNVPHVGHSHPRIRAAVDRQMRWINTNTRYLQPVHAAYCEALLKHFPESLSRVFLLSSGSEANELAVRLARAATGARDMIALRAGYHGHTVTAIDLSDYKAGGPGGEGVPDWVHLIDNPDTFAGPFRGADAATRYAGQVDEIVARLAGRPLAGLIAETFPSVGGQVVPPDGYLQAVYRAVRAAGGLCIADEVQTGLGRLGEHFWGFEQQQVTPDIVVLGKPLGNGYPLAAVVTTDAIATAFDTGMEFFATFGGSSVACAAGKAVLEVIEDEALPARASQVGAHLKTGLEALAKGYPVLSDVRGLGLFLGVAMTDADRQPLPALTDYLVQRLREHRVLIGSDGPHHNVLKIRPPLAFSRDDADHLLHHLEQILEETPLSLASARSADATRRAPR